MIEQMIVRTCYLLRIDRVLALVLMISAAALIVLSVIGWLFGAIALSAMAKHRQVKGRWMGWFPVLNMILLGRIHDIYMADVRSQPTERRRSLPILSVTVTLSLVATIFLWFVQRQTLLISYELTIALMAVAACALLLTIIYVAQIYTTYYNIYYSCTPDDAPLLTVLVVAFPILIPFFLLGLRKKENGMPPRSEYTGK